MPTNSKRHGLDHSDVDLLLQLTPPLYVYCSWSECCWLDELWCAGDVWVGAPYAGRAVPLHLWLHAAEDARLQVGYFKSVLRIHDILVWIRILLFSSLTFKMPTKNNFCLNIFSAYYCLKVHLHNFPKIKSQKESQNSRNQGFSYYFCMMTEGSGSISLTSGSGSESGRPKNMWIWWIRIKIRIRNTAWKYVRPRPKSRQLRTLRIPHVNGTLILLLMRNPWRNVT